MNKIQSYLLGLLACVAISGLIVLFICRNRIYTWTLGDVPTLYAKAVNHYKAREYQEALPLFEKLAGIDSAAYAKFLLGDMYYVAWEWMARIIKKHLNCSSNRQSRTIQMPITIWV